MPDLVSQKEFARRMKYRPSYVTKLKKAGRLVMVENKVDVKASQRLINETESGLAQHSAARRYWQRARNGETNPAPQNENETPAERGTRSAWELRDAAARALTRELELKERTGELVKTESVQRAAAEVGATVRAMVENLPDQLAPLLAPETDENKVHAIIAEHVEALLGEVARKIDGMGQSLSRDHTP